MKLAGAERQVAIAGFKPFVADGLLDVVMPDIKYAGGYAEMLNIAGLCANHNVGFSPHTDGEMERCMGAVIKKWKFPAFSGDPVQVEAPVNLVAK